MSRSKVTLPMWPALAGTSVGRRELRREQRATAVADGPDSACSLPSKRLDTARTESPGHWPRGPRGPYGSSCPTWPTRSSPRSRMPSKTKPSARGFSLLLGDSDRRSGGGERPSS